MRRIPVATIAIVTAILMTLGIASCSTPAPPNTGVIGTWNVTYGSPGVVNIESTGTNEYAMVGKVKLTRGTCQLPVGTTIATFTGSGATYSGRHGLWYVNTCSFAYWTTVNLTLVNANTINEKLANGESYTLTRVSPATTHSSRTWLWLAPAFLAVAAAAFFVFRRKQHPADVTR